MRSFEIRANPCPHDLEGHPHASLVSAYLCMVENGNPGVTLTEVEL